MRYISRCTTLVEPKRAAQTIVVKVFKRTDNLGQINAGTARTCSIQQPSVVGNDSASKRQSNQGFFKVSQSIKGFEDMEGKPGQSIFSHSLHIESDLSSLYSIYNRHSRSSLASV